MAAKEKDVSAHRRKNLHHLLQQGRYLNTGALRTCPPTSSTDMERFELILAVGQICRDDKQTNRLTNKQRIGAL